MGVDAGKRKIDLNRPFGVAQGDDVAAQGNSRQGAA
jgi:hypothetical protein